MSRRAESMFRDEAVLRCTAGKGGAGCSSMHREKYVNMGGPDGGDGGDGGSVLLRADAQENSLYRLARHHHVRAEDGRPGEGNNRTGRSGADLELVVPVGTQVLDAEHGNVLADLDEDGAEVVIARGGKGGRGNARFASATNQAPTHAERGLPGEDRELRLELKLVAEVGVIGLPNAGKSTLLARLSAARPRIADYPFTTLGPHLGIVEAGEARFVLADLPGLIEGAHRGQGLGDRFLRHVERTRVLLHLVDLAPIDAVPPAERYARIRHELEAYGRGLAARPEIVVGTKADALDAGAREAALSGLARAADRRVIAVSAVTGLGLEALLGEVVRALEGAPAPPDVPSRLPPEGGAA